MQATESVSTSSDLFLVPSILQPFVRHMAEPAKVHLAQSLFFEEKVSNFCIGHELNWQVGPAHSVTSLQCDSPLLCSGFYPNPMSDGICLFCAASRRRGNDYTTNVFEGLGEAQYQ